uniref:ATP synthase complex subunit 8 n=1 Tax=Cleptocaccobius convexifrons TaxID=206826 RepID=A0A1X9HDC2_9SCAR|nr:ATP synthase F0 subunit 8 [Cleptocaccobius convexifrons]
MPQMAPINWLSLLIYFSLMFMMFNILNYFSFNYNFKIFKFKKNNQNLNWKW